MTNTIEVLETIVALTTIPGVIYLLGIIADPVSRTKLSALFSSDDEEEIEMDSLNF